MGAPPVPPHLSTEELKELTLTRVPSLAGVEDTAIPTMDGRPVSGNEDAEAPPQAVAERRDGARL